MKLIEIQRLLNLKGFGPLDEDGKDGPKTQLAIKKFQVSRNLTSDGIIGPKTLAALLVNDTPTPTPTPTIPEPEVFIDKLSIERIERLHPKLRQEAKLILAEINQKTYTKASFCRITYSLRTFKQQQDLYNLGRTVVNPDGKTAKKPKGNIVTNAKAGQSIHNYGLAVDIAFVINGKDGSWDTKKDWDKDGQADWMEVVAVFKKYGWEWGGDWRTFKDMPHFQKTLGYSWQKLLNLVNAGKIDKEGYAII